jgi:MFS family permease
VYQVSNSNALLSAHRRLFARGQATKRVSGTVVLLGLTSLFTDISSEMVATVLPLYLVFVAGFSPLAFGFIDGLYNGAAALMNLASGYVGDRFRRHKEVAATGYGLSAICKGLLFVAGGAVSVIGAIVLLDRAGKGIRTAPRDAMISLSTPKDELGAAFGVHRALDTTGAMLGPLLAFGILMLIPLGFSTIFLVSFLVALIGLAILVLFVQPRRVDEAPAEELTTPSLKRAFGLVKQPHYRGLMFAAGALSLMTASDAFIFLALRDKLDLSTSLFPLLYVGSSAIFMVLASPVGRLADRVGRGRVLFSGYALLLLVYVSLLSPLGGWPLLVVALGFLGAYYAATDGVLMAMGSAVVPDEVRASGLALLGTTTNLAKFMASMVFGLLWTLWGVQTALVCFSAGLVAAALLAVFVLVRAPRQAQGV